MKKFILLLSALLLSMQVQAALVDGGTMLANTTILLEDDLTNTEQQAFDEVQGLTLVSDLTFANHYGNTTILAGTRVDNHIGLFRY